MHHIQKLDPFNFRFIQCKLADFPKRFNMSAAQMKGFYPFSFLSKDTLAYLGPFPNIDYFVTFSDNNSDIAKKREFLQTCQNLKFFTPIQTLKYCLQDVTLLMTGVIAFQMEAIEMEKKFYNIYNFSVPSDRLKYILPMATPHLTLGGFRYLPHFLFPLNTF